MDAASLEDAAHELWDRTAKRLSAFDIHYALRDLITGLRTMRETSDPGHWAEFAAADHTDHPLASMLMTDPMTARSYHRPRGYPGDAELLDLVYAWGPLPQDVSCLGAVIYATLVQSSAPRAARDRLGMLARFLTQTRSAADRPRILSVACGHLREAHAVGAGFGDFFALDQDEESLAVVKRELSDAGVTAVSGSVKTLLRGTTKFGDLDLVYASGLYDYLPQPTGQALTAILASFLKPGGRLIIANYVSGLPDQAFMELFMRWNIVYRTDQDVYQLAADIPPERIASTRIFHDREGRLAFLELTTA